MHFIDLLITKILLNLKSEASRSYLSYCWWVLEPVLEMLVFYVVFGIFLAFGTENYVAFLLTGLVPWTWFARSIGNSMNCLSGSGWLLNQVRIHPVFFPLVELGQDFIKQGITFLFLLLFLLAYGIDLTLYWLWLPVLIVLQACFVAAVGIFVASVIPFMSDLRFLVNTSIQVLFFASGIFFSIDLVTEDMRLWFFMNPMASLIDLYRTVLLVGASPPLWMLNVVIGWSIAFSLVAGLIMQKNKWRYARLILE